MYLVFTPNWGHKKLKLGNYDGSCQPKNAGRYPSWSGKIHHFSFPMGHLYEQLILQFVASQEVYVPQI